MYNNCKQQVEHECVNKNNIVTCRGIEPQFFIKPCPLHHKLPTKKIQHPHKQQTTPTAQNRSPKNQKTPTTCWAPKTRL